MPRVPLPIVLKYDARTSSFGDIVEDAGPCQPTVKGYLDCWTPSEGFIGFTDISATVDKFVNLPSGPAKSRADVCPCSVDQKVDFSDIPCVVDGFLILPFPCTAPPNPCP